MLVLLEIFWTFFKIGLFTIGGGYAMIPMIKSEVIMKNWITEEELVNFLAISESTPGPFAINIATFIGASQYGLLGAIVGTIGVILPSFIIIIIIFKIYQKVIKNIYVNATMNGIKSIVVGLIFSVAIALILKEVFKNGYSFTEIDFKSLIIIVILGTLMLIFKKKLNPIIMILIGAVMGVVLFGFTK